MTDQDLTPAELVRCSADAYCKFLEDRIEPEANARRKGFVLMVLMNMTTGTTRKIGVVYKLSAKDGGLFLNGCPFCGERIDSTIYGDGIKAETLAEDAQA